MSDAGVSPPTHVPSPPRPVVVVGYGPVGQVLAATLGLRGHEVVVLEQHESRYSLPRAAHLDGGAIRVLQSIGVADAVVADCWPQRSYDFLDSDRQLLHHIDFDRVDPSGWSAGYFCHGPTVEAVVDRRVQTLEAVTVRMGTRLVDLRFAGDRVEVVLESGEHLDASWVVGADGANSTVRRIAAIGQDDLGYTADWLVVDVAPDDPDLAVDMPEAAQICHPVRPISVFRRLGHHHLRIECPVQRGDEWTTSAVWSLLAGWGLTASNSTIVRNAIYTFASRLAVSLRHDRVLLAGDAAHLMPPFLGQGLCSGLRDVAALGWRLDRVLSGRSHPDLLDTYGDERRPHVRTLIEASSAVGHIIGADVPSHETAAALAALPATPDTLSQGLLDPKRRPGTGTVAPQAIVGLDGTQHRSDDVAAGRWLLLLRDNPGDVADDFARLDVLLQTLAHTGPGYLEDIESTLTRWFRSLDAVAVLIRPDHYVHTVLQSVDELPTLLTTLAEQLAGSGGHP